MWNFIEILIPAALLMTAPILLTALGGLFSERSGVVNIGLEGLMTVGAFTSALFIFLVNRSLNPYTYEQVVSIPNYMIWVAIIVGGLAALLFSALHAFASISLKADQVISGTAINLLAAAGTIFLASIITTRENIKIENISGITIPGLSKIPILGPLFFQDQYITTYLIFIFAIVVWYIVFKTPFGLRLRACGEYPQAADSMGVNVVRMRYISVLTSGLLAGLGGAILLVTTSTEFYAGTIHGLGFLALAALIFGKWKPINVIWSTLFFGTMATIGSLASYNKYTKGLPDELYNVLPYVMTLVALVIFSKNAAAPKALGEPYDAGKR